MDLMLFTQLGFGELLFVLIIILILFGPKKLPELARAVGRARREYEIALKEEPKPEVEEEKEGGTKEKKEKSEEEVLLETAKKLGIDTEGKSIEEIADEILKRVKGSS